MKIQYRPFLTRNKLRYGECPANQLVHQRHLISEIHKIKGAAFFMSDDAILIEQTLAGSASAFETLVQRYKGSALAMAMQYVHNFHDAQDITQEAFFSTYLHLPKLTDHSCFKSWFFQIVINHAKMLVRTQTRREQRE